MGVKGLKRYQNRNFRGRYGFYCPKTNRIWISSKPDALVRYSNMALFGEIPHNSPDGNWFETENRPEHWDPYLDLPENLLWE